MHRELSPTEDALRPGSYGSLYLLTAIIGLLIARDLFPLVAGWFGQDASGWTREFYGYRYALIAAVLGGARVLYGSLESLFEGRLGADLALAIACIAAILIGEPLVAAEVVFIGLFGECLEAVIFARTQRELGKLVEIFPRRCWRLRDGVEERVLTSQLNVGDVVVVKPGGKVPVDGIVLAGQSAVNVAVLTGESVPLDKAPGDEVLAGSISTTGQLTIEARRVAAQTLAGQVIDLTTRALRDKAPLERNADRLARYFLPVVLGLAALTFLANLGYYLGPLRPSTDQPSLSAAARLSIYPTLAVLVVACPCALILATPAAIIAALGRLAGTGVLIKGGAAIERLAQVRCFAFDKTGTLTEGRPQVDEVHLLAGGSVEELLSLAAAAEQPSEHPLAQAVVRAARERGLSVPPISDFAAHPGAGVSGRLPEGEVLVGTRSFLAARAVAIPPEADAIIEQLDRRGQTALLVAWGGRLLGVIGTRDRIRPEARQVIDELKANGIGTVALITGDRHAVAQQVAAEAGIDTVHAELLPQQKADWVRQHEQAATAFVGDGVNDAPALATAGVGLAVGSGTDVAAEAGDVVLLGQPLTPLPFLVRLARQTVRVIRQNILIFGFVVNLIGVVLTAWLWPLFSRAPGWLESAPLAGVIYHQIGSALVLFNSMRLLAFERTATLRVVQGWRELLDRLDRLSAQLNLDELLHQMGHHWRTVLTVAAALLVSAYALSCCTIIAPDEVGIVKRFGRALPDDLGPGLHLRYPWPIESVVRVKPNEVRTVSLGFRVREGGTPGSGGNPKQLAGTWASVHGRDVTRLPDESIMLTGDGNLIELLVTVQYHIANPRHYLFAVRDVEPMLRDVTESVLRQMLAAADFLEVLTSDRAKLQDAALRRIIDRCLSLDAGGLGIQIDGLALHDLHPPPEVVPAYHEVIRAIDLRQRMINEARTAAVYKVRDAESRALERVRRAEAERFEKIEQAKATRDAFLKWSKDRQELPASVEAELSAQLRQRLDQGINPEVAHDQHKRLYAQKLAEQRALTEFRLALEVMVDVLGKRDKILVDADEVRGRRSLFIGNADLFRPQLLQPLERNRIPPPAPLREEP